MSEVLRSTVSPTSSTDSIPHRNITHVTAVAIRQFLAEGPSELSIQRHERLQILYHSNKKWAFVRRSYDGKMGYVPLSFCAPIDPSIPIPDAQNVIKYVTTHTHASTMTSCPPTPSDDTISVSSNASTSMSDTGFPSPASSSSSWETSKIKPQQIPLNLEAPKKTSSLSSSCGGDSGIGLVGQGDSVSGETSSNCSTPRQNLESSAFQHTSYMETELDSSSSIGFESPEVNVSDQEGNINGACGSKLSRKHVTFNPDTEVFGGSVVSLTESVSTDVRVFTPPLTFLEDCPPYETFIHEDLNSIDTYTLV